MKMGNNAKKKEKKNPPKASKKKRDKDLQILQERHKSATKGVEPNPKVEMNKVQATLSRFLLN